VKGDNQESTANPVPTPTLFSKTLLNQKLPGKGWGREKNRQERTGRIQNDHIIPKLFQF